ncbi:MAG TPA: hypothetical protein VEL76_25100 [Gemmataceae bacterium]|nr:hypothetical protein [Gemmataceae bacterium]
MIRSLRLIAVVGLLAGPVAVQAQEAFTIKIKKAAEGETTRAEKKEQGTEQTKIADNNGNLLKEEAKKHSKHAVYKETVLEKKASQPRPVRLKRQYETATVTENGEKKTLPYQGKTVLIEKKGERYTFKIEGGEELTGEDAKLLNEEFNKKGKFDEDTFEKLFLPGKAVKVGETWKLDTQVIVKALREEGKMELDADKLKATGSLTKAYKKDGKQFGVIVLRIEVAPKAFGDGGMIIPLQPGAKLSIEATVDTCIDGTSSTGTGTFNLAIAAEALLPDANNPMFRLNVNVKAGGTYQNTEQ